MVAAFLLNIFRTVRFYIQSLNLPRQNAKSNAIMF